MMRKRWASMILVLGIALPPVLLAQAAPGNLGGSSLEELMNIEVTSVSKKEQTLSKTAAAVYVIGQEDIRRSGATNIPDLLRMAPGVEVAQIDANQWAISVRGFNSVYSDKVLVMVDGRTVYVSTFSGVYWDELDVPLEDIERIEVIRGPGGTVWGANAVNGVINIITKNAADTKGGLVTGGGGSQSTGQGLVQYGGHAGSSGAYRIFGKFATIDSSLFPGGQPAADGWRRAHAGFRSDWRLSARDTVSVQGDLVSSAGGATTNAILVSPLPVQTAIDNRLNDTSGDIFVRWDRTLANGSSSLQVYDSGIRRREAGARIANDVVDIDFERHLTVGARHDVVWGLDYRNTRDNIQSAAEYSIRFNPPARTINLFAAFLQDEVRLNRSLYLTFGSKIEHNGFTGFEYEPSAQLIWTRNDRQSLWVSAARAIRQPDRSEFSAEYNLALEPVPGAGTALLKIFGNPQFKAERLNDFEGGYRTQASRRLSLDLTTFVHRYSRLESIEPEAPFVTIEGGAPLLVLPLIFGNLASAHDYGFEVFANWNVSRRWKISPSYSTLRMNVTTDPSSHDTVAHLLPGDSPRQQVQVRSLTTLRKNVDWDSSFKYVTSLSSLSVPGYGRLDTRIAWHAQEFLEVSINGENLASAHHIEFLDNSGLFLRTEVARSVFAKVSWRFP